MGQELEAEAQLGRVLPSVARVIRIVRGKKVDADWAVRTDLFEQPQEDALYQAYQAVAAEVRQPPEPHPLLPTVDYSVPISRRDTRSVW